jgi:hypothetical protein
LRKVSYGESDHIVPNVDASEGGSVDFSRYEIAVVGRAVIYVVNRYRSDSIDIQLDSKSIFTSSIRRLLRRKLIYADEQPRMNFDT